MKETDLMIGDWVYDTMRQENKKVTRMDFERNPMNGVYYAETLLPIPLTSDILVKNGFQKLNDKTFLLKNQIEIEVGPKFSEVSARYEDYDRDFNSYNNCYIEIAIIHYVHQLQHLLRLMGVQNEIEL